MNLIFSCAICERKSCLKGRSDFPENCPTDIYKKSNSADKNIYFDDKETNEIMKISDGLLKNENGDFRDRFEEIIELIKKMHFKKIGVAFCVALTREARYFINLLRNEDVAVAPVCCKTRAINSYDIGVKKNKDFIASCNPVSQAEILNNENTDLNVVIGLCVGHDIIFNKYIKGLTTTLITKDRKYANCPVKALT